MEKTKHSHKGHRQRLKNKALESGVECWPHHEVLELILTYTIPYKDVNPLAHELIEQFGSLGNVLDAGYEHLRKINGVGHETALFLSLLPDIFDKYNASKQIDAVYMDTPYKCVQYFKSISHVKNYEEFIVFCLDNKKRLVKTIKMNSGKSSNVSFSLNNFSNQIAFPANKSIIVMHSHPGGDANPTMQDIKATRQLIATCLSVGVAIDDHIIVSDNNEFSFKNDYAFSQMIKEVKQGMESLLDPKFIEEPIGELE